MNRHNLNGEFRFWRAPSLPSVEFLQVKDVSFSYPLHIHDEHSVGVMLEGVEHVVLRRRMYVARPGDLLLINADEPHANVSARATYRVVKITTEALRDLAREITGADLMRAPLGRPVATDSILRHAVNHLFRAVDEDASDLDLQSSFLAMVTVLFNGQLRLPAREMSIERRPVAAARRYLREHYADNVSLARLAEVVNLSAFHFLRTFRDQIGVSPHEYQLQFRIGVARKLLRADYAIADVAAQTGFCDQSHFSRHFKRIVGMTPGEYALHSKIVQDSSTGRAVNHAV